MLVELGNIAAVESVFNQETQQHEDVDLPGERVSSFTLPDDIPLATAFLAVVDGFNYHAKVGAVPVWIEGDSDGLVALLCQHYGVPPKTQRPRDWGQRSDR